jgi:hypothetical protein
VLLCHPVRVLSLISSHTDAGDILVCAVLEAIKPALGLDDLCLPLSNLLLLLAFLATCKDTG